MNRTWAASLFAILILPAVAPLVAARPTTEPVPDPSTAGGESRGLVRVGNLVYAQTMTAKCFSDHFLAQAAHDSTINTTGKLQAVRLDSDDVFDFPLIVMSGEGPFTLTDRERTNLQRYLNNGGLLLASAGCSSPEWDRSFRDELARALPDTPFADLPMSHPIFHTVYDIAALHTRHGDPKLIQGVALQGGRLAVIYSFEGLNDTATTTGCCCCGGNEITNAADVNVNVLAYALTH